MISEDPIDHLPSRSSPDAIAFEVLHAEGPPDGLPGPHFRRFEWLPLRPRCRGERELRVFHRPGCSARRRERVVKPGLGTIGGIRPLEAE
jgi:hypothetical protein